jgi:hypothetical protein
VNPTAIIRGSSFTVSGTLTDVISGEPLENEPLYVFWDYFNEAEYYADPSGFFNTYGIASGQTNDLGEFSINCLVDSSRTTGAITVYTFYPGNLEYGEPQFTNQIVVDSLDCYARVFLGLQVNSTSVRIGEKILATAGLLFDNLTTVNAANGLDIAFNWLGETTNSTIFSGIATNLSSVPTGTILGTHPYKASFYVPALGLPYVVGRITSSSQIGTNAADWANFTVTVTVHANASIVFAINDPISPGPGLYPEVVREVTTLNITGVLTAASGEPFGTPVDVDLYVHDSSTTSTPSYLQASTSTDNDGNFNFLVTLSGSYLSTGDNFIWVDVDNASIEAERDIDLITIFGNATLDSFTVTESTIMPGETIHITGSLADDYNSDPVEGMIVRARWEDFGTIFESNSSSSGNFAINLVTPTTLGSSISNGTVYVQFIDTFYYTRADNTSFTVDVFSEVYFTIWLNSTNVIEDSTITNIAGNPIYNNFSLTFQGWVVDQFDRNVTGRDITLSAGGANNTLTLNSEGRFSQIVTESNIAAGTYPIAIIFDDDTTYNFNFSIVVTDFPVTTTPTPTNTPPQGGGNQMIDTAQALIYSSISIGSLIVIIAAVYAFGRFRKSRKLAKESEPMNMPTITERIEEAVRAKDFNRAVILCYHAFVVICMRNFGIMNAQKQSPRELARTVASVSSIPVRDVTMLIMRYEEARFSDHKVGKEKFKLARQALQNIQLAIEQTAKQEKS